MTPTPPTPPGATMPRRQPASTPPAPPDEAARAPTSCCRPCGAGTSTRPALDPVIVLLCLSGIVYLFKPQIDGLAYGHLRDVTPRAQTASYAQQQRAVAAAYRAPRSRRSPPPRRRPRHRVRSHHRRGRLAAGVRRSLYREDHRRARSVELAHDARARPPRDAAHEPLPRRGRDVGRPRDRARGVVERRAGRHGRLPLVATRAATAA